MNGTVAENRWLLLCVIGRSEVSARLIWQFD